MTLMPEFSSSLITIGIWAVVSYLFGAIPFGIVWARLFGLGDLRSIGSGNIGATNVLRTGNKFAAFLTLVFDAGKGGIMVLLANMFADSATAQVSGFMAFIGHCYPVWLGFKGGKGVATFLGVLLTLSFPVGLAACASWLITAIIFRISSLSALVAAASTPIWAIFLGYAHISAVTMLLTILVFWRHRENITRIINKTEPKIGKK